MFESPPATVAECLNCEQPTLHWVSQLDVEYGRDELDRDVYQVREKLQCATCECEHFATRWILDSVDAEAEGDGEYPGSLEKKERQ